jgi:hypothetical protein
MEYVKIEKETGELALELPQEYRKYENELQAALTEEYAFEAMTAGTISRMNMFVADWLEKKGMKPPSQQA